MAFLLFYFSDCMMCVPISFCILVIEPHNTLAQSAWGVEYANCISVECLVPTNKCPVCDIKQFDGKAPGLDLWGI